MREGDGVVRSTRGERAIAEAEEREGANSVRPEAKGLQLLQPTQKHPARPPPSIKHQLHYPTHLRPATNLPTRQEFPPTPTPDSHSPPSACRHSFLPARLVELGLLAPPPEGAFLRPAQ